MRITGLRSAPDSVIEEVMPNTAVLLRDRRYRRSLAVADALSALVALVFATNVFGGNQLSPRVLLGLPLLIVACKLRGLYDRDELVIRKTTVDEAPALLELATLSTLAAWMLDGVLLNGPLSKSSALLLWGLLLVLGLLFRRVARYVASRAVEAERLLLIGDAGTYSRLQTKLEAGNVHARLVGRMSLQRVSDFSLDERPVDEATLAHLVRDLDAHRVLVVPSQTNPQITVDLIRATKAIGVRASIVPHVFDVVGQSVVFDDLGGMTILGVREFALGRSSQLVKRAFDLAGAITALLVVAPVLALIALLIKVDSRGPVFFRQVRIGRDGEAFRIFKFRTMDADAEARKAELMAHNEANGLFKIADDPRITRVGRFLRKTSLDELPQLLNVLLGEMSLVGPRPLILSEDETITGYDRRRLHLTPGMTGHWQIMGSSRVPMHEMLKIDYLYVTTWTLFEDIKILLRTVPYMLARRGM
ncbi:exopolysaccharide biosynthesis polyprenyl glycosylphosphotransferase [Baekduia sp. Peel2402]|uniref:exopolysaccharide biosynthesis polyprenyl glycosylphosphotransferase n=1 Tax=Baekduia sp. Peel2402 TaxID=3458296 RepID=UPI00403EBDF9